MDDKIEAASCVSTDALIFTLISWYLHYNDMCLLGFCYTHRSYQRHHQYRTSFASYLFFMVASFIAASFSLWPERLGDPPKGFFNILYKIWVGVILYNFTERLVWFALYEIVSYALEFMSDALRWISEQTGNPACGDCFDSLKGDYMHRLILTVIALYCLYAYVILRGCLAFADGAVQFIKKHLFHREMDNATSESSDEMDEDERDKSNSCCKLKVQKSKSPKCNARANYDYSSYT